MIDFIAILVSYARGGVRRGEPCNISSGLPIFSASVPNMGRVERLYWYSKCAQRLKLTQV
jgi:hypothetical protein